MSCSTITTVRPSSSAALRNCCIIGTEDGQVLRTLCLPDPGTLHLSISDSGGGGGTPRVPTERSIQEWDWAEGQRGLLLVEALAATWGHHRLAPWADLGTNVWATFTLDPDTIPPGLAPYVFTRST